MISKDQARALALVVGGGYAARNGGWQVVKEIDTGTLSAVWHEFSYGSSQDLWEIAFVPADGGDMVVEGWQTPGEVVEFFATQATQA